jgi:hypothetical protein
MTQRSDPDWYLRPIGAPERGQRASFRDREKLRRKIKSRRKNECKRKKVPKTPKNEGSAGFGEFLSSADQRSLLPKGDLIREHEPVRSTFLILPS